jgi:Flp pilus assembly protein TadD
VEELSPQLLTALGAALWRAGADPVPLLAAAQECHPTDFWLNFDLANVLAKKQRWGEAAGYYRAALAVRPETGAAHNNLGCALERLGRPDEAIRAYRRALALDPKDAAPHNNLGTTLADQGRLEDAIREYRRAIDLALAPEGAQFHNNLGLALHDQGRVDDAIREYRRAIARNPKGAEYHNHLGTALKEKGRLDDAIREYRTALELDPKDAKAHNNLGNALKAQGRLDDAIRELRTAIALDPKLAQAHNNLGTALHDQGRLEEAIREYRRAIDLDPKLAAVHVNLGNALKALSRLDDAIQEYRRSLDLFPEKDPLRQPLTQQVRQCERLLAAEGRLPAILRGEAQPADAAERLALAQLCQQHKQLYAASARFYAEAFVEQPRLGDDLQAGHRYNAACAAALAGGGQGRDADRLDDQGRARLRRQARDWLRADLAAWTDAVDKAPPQGRPVVRDTLRHWQKDPDLAGLRDPGALARLPEAERQACRKLWADVEALLRKARD